MTVLTPPGTGLRPILDLEGTPSSSAANGMWPARSGPISVLLVGESVETRVADGVLFGGALAVAGEMPVYLSSALDGPIGIAAAAIPTGPSRALER